MIVCVCNRLSERNFACALAEGACTAHEAFERLGCSPRCGRCVPYVHEAVRERHSQNASAEGGFSPAAGEWAAAM